MNIRELNPTIEYVERYDPEIAVLMGRELARQKRNLELIASENIASPAVIACMGTILTNKYAEGTPAATTRGMKEADMDIIAQCIYDTAVDFEGTQAKVRSTVEALTAKYPIYE